MTNMLLRWHDPIFNNPYEHLSERLATRLTEMAEETMAGEDVAQALAEGNVPRASGKMPVFPQRFNGLPGSLLVYNERLQALVAVAAVAKTTDLANYEPAADTKSHVGFVLGRAAGSGCSLADIAIAAGVAPEQVTAIAKRTIPGTSWF